MHERLSRADIHIHSSYSDGQADPGEIVERAVKEDLKVIAVTDHDTLEGGKLTLEYAQRVHAPLGVILGYEFSTPEGHVSFLFPNPRSAVPPGQLPKSMIGAIGEVRSTNGNIVLIPHPGYLLYGLSLKSFIFSLAHGIEVTSGHAQALKGLPIFIHPEKYVQLKTVWPNLADIGSSDAHFLEHVGSGFTIFEGETIDDFVKAVKQGRTKAVLRENGLPTLADYIRSAMIFYRKYGIKGFTRSLRCKPFVNHRE